MSARPRILIVGQAPGPTPSTSRRALDGRCGRRLERLMGIPEGALPRVARTVNLLPEWPGRSPSGKGDRFPVAEASQVAATLMLRGVVLFAGRGVAAAFGVRAPFFRWLRLGSARVAVVPHPSGISRWWNDPRNQDTAARFFRALVRGRAAVGA